MEGALAILGPGQLGLSLARHAAERGLRVHLLGRDRAHAQTGLQRLQQGWNRAVEGGRMPATERDQALERLQPMREFAEALEGAEALLEALPEDLDLKRRFWENAASNWPEVTLALTGSSCLAASEICAEPRLALLNFHPFVPVHRHPIVELAAASEQQIPRARALAARLGLQVIEVSSQGGLPGARMGLIQGLEAMRLVEEGAAEPAALDALMTGGYGLPCGPLELSDRIGLDLRLAIAEHLHRTTGHPRFEPPALLRRLVAEGRLGRKAGRGFYEWTHEGGRS